MGRDYSAAVEALNTLQSNFATISKIRKSSKDMNALAIPEMIDWCRKAGHEPSDFDRLNPIHVAGTKGKGSTSSFVSSILAQYLPSVQQSAPILRKIGLYTSPHLRFVRERIQLDNKPIDEEAFAKYFFEVWDQLDAAAKDGNTAESGPTKPMYFRYLTLMAFHAYLEEGVDTAIIECGIGGEYDSTNILVNPSVTAITSLGIDHTPVLGPTIEEIAWHKAGIMKPSAPAFTAPQPAGALEVLYKRAAEKGVALTVVERHPELENITLGLDGDFQKTNASLAIAVAAAQLRKLGLTSLPDPVTTPNFPLPAEFRRGLETVHLGGRCEIKHDGKITWHIDGGHTLDSIAFAGTWFGGHVARRRTQKRVLVFNQQTSDRNAEALARTLHATLCDALKTEAELGTSPFTHAIFCTNTTFKTGFSADLTSVVNSGAEVDSMSVQKALAETWREIDPVVDVSVLRTIEEAVEKVREIAGGEEEVMALITGSLHLVGGALEVLETGN
ncbi:putative tetrahydrofolylpolyglutamate synthase [Pseudovirgaria hyperparasitica]|uniref:Folylpolyglutamate synthase n=1 Tax=Pseudovirgaria hyperparasitica TaxID=470096 RepID=A0A6A6VZ32_9PEZI|nr:putative tetrahydrofolylpolyglutamate synthase [Pseudovirgaria hyperparasitica]KAF2755139.1 putative tetrahydrofolylpolyglutamate synthase [Pseudovirgaria hyperparasitica]